MNLKKATLGLVTTAYLFASAPQSFAGDRDVDLQGDIFSFGENVRPQQLISFAINAAFFIAILLALIYLIWGGINWIMSGGDKEKVGAARSKIIAAIIGLILVILSYVILNFVLVIFTGEGVNNLTIPSLQDSNPGVVN